MENNVIQIAVSSVTIVGAVGYIIHSAWTSYRKSRENIYEKLDKKLDKKQCDEYRRIEERHEDSHRGGK